MIYYKSISFRWGAERYMTPAARRLKAEYETLQKELIAKKGFKAEGEQPYKKPAYDGVFLPSYLEHVNETFIGINLRPGQHLVDLGSGDGRVVFLAALFGARSVGIEGDEELCQISLQMRERLLAVPEFAPLHNTEIRRSDLFDQDLSQFDIAFMYEPQPKDPSEFYEKLKIKLMAELKPGSLFISHSYCRNSAYIERRP